MIEKILNNTTPYGKIRASHEGSLHSSTLNRNVFFLKKTFLKFSLLFLSFLLLSSKRIFHFIFPCMLNHKNLTIIKYFIVKHLETQ